MKAEISGGVKVLSPSLMRSTSPAARSSASRKGNSFSSSLHVLDAAAHEAFHAVHRALRRLDQILARGAAHNDLAVLVQRDDRRHQVQTVLAGNHDRTVAFHVGHQRVGGAQIDADNAFVGHSLFAIRRSLLAIRFSQSVRRTASCSLPSSCALVLRQSSQTRYAHAADILAD